MNCKMQRRWSTSNYIIMCLSGTWVPTCIRTVFGFWGGTINGRVHTVVHIYVCTIMEDASVRVRVSVYREKIKTNSWSFEK